MVNLRSLGSGWVSMLTIDTELRERRLSGKALITAFIVSGLADSRNFLDIDMDISFSYRRSVHLLFVLN